MTTRNRRNIARHGANWSIGHDGRSFKSRNRYSPNTGKIMTEEDRKRISIESRDCFEEYNQYIAESVTPDQEKGGSI